MRHIFRVALFLVKNMGFDGINALTISHHVVSMAVKNGDLCIDATAGRGKDTVFLCSLVGESGKVLSFDIQDEAIESTKQAVAENGYEKIADIKKCSHSEMDKFAQNGTVACIMFNFGWLPGGNHNIHTQAQTSIEAIEKGLALLRSGGVMSLCIYYGKETGFEERDALLNYFKTIECKNASVLVCDFVNRPNCPAIGVFIFKDK